MSSRTGNPGRSMGPVSSVSTIGLSARVVTALHQGRAIVNRLLDHPPPETCPGAYESACRVPYEIVEMVIAHLARDIRTLKVCSLTCHSWHIAALPHLRHTLTLKGNTHGTTRNELGPLSKLHKLGQIPLVKEIQVKQLCGAGSRGWFAPRAFSHRDLRYFSAFTNVHTLRFKELEIYRFIPDIERYFGHFSPTLRSITLFNPHCTPQQLSYFLSLFSNLDDIEIRRIDIHVPNITVPNKGPISSSVPKLRGRLTAHQTYQIEAWTHLITLCSGLRFHYMNLHDVADCVPVLLEACTETLETLRFNATDDSAGFHPLPSPEFNLSRLKVLRSLEVAAWVAKSRLGYQCHGIVAGVFSTITSPVFSELVIVLADDVPCPHWEATLFRTLRTMNEVRPFKLVFLLEVPDSYKGEFESGLNLVAAKGALDFLDSPPTIRLRSRH